MNAKLARSVFTLGVVLLMSTCLGFARSSSSHTSSTKSFDVRLDSAAKLNNGDLLQAGDYKLRIVTNGQTAEVAFYRDGDLVGKTQARVDPQSQKNPFTAIETTQEGNAQVVSAIDPGGLREKIVFNN